MNTVIQIRPHRRDGHETNAVELRYGRRIDDGGLEVAVSHVADAILSGAESPRDDLLPGMVYFYRRDYRVGNLYVEEADGLTAEKLRDEMAAAKNEGRRREFEI